MNSKPLPSIVIPATQEATDAYRLAQSQASVKREDLRQVGRTVFKRGKPLDPEQCLMTTPIDSWTPLEGRGGLKNIIPVADQGRLDKLFSHEGLAATIALTDTAAGVRERIDYDENEIIIKELMDDQSKNNQ